MAIKVTTTLVDDIDGMPIENDKGETIKFSLEGTSYEIDLNPENAKALRDALKPYIKAGRSVVAGRRSSGTATKSNRDELNAIREWAALNGIAVSARGRIAQSIQDQYHAST
jgi:hypothetical protein